MSTAFPDPAAPAPAADLLLRTVFSGHPVRALAVRLDRTWGEIAAQRAYPQPLARLLGELTAAAALLYATVKQDASLVMQLQGRGALKLLVVECRPGPRLRATAQWEGDFAAGTLRDWAGDGRLAITLERPDDPERYQSIVDLEGQHLSDVLESYMTRSEQLDTRLKLAADAGSAAGVLLQRLPRPDAHAETDADADPWARFGLLLDTVQPAELLATAPDALLTRLYPGDGLRVLAADRPRFECGCSRAKVSDMLRVLGRAEVEGVVEEHGVVDVTCEFCNSHYRFSDADVQTLFAPNLHVH